MTIDDVRRQHVEDFVRLVQGQLIVSCQALEHEPLHGAEIMARMAIAAVAGGGVAIRANSPVDIAAIRKAVSVPIIGLYKDEIEGYPVYITPTMRHALAVGDRFTVLNRGKTLGTAQRGQITPEELQDLMAGGQEMAQLEGSLGGTV